MEIGKAKYASKNKEFFKIKDGDNVFRILPPLGSLAKAGRWSEFYKVIWGFSDSSKKRKPFISPYVKNFKTQMVEVPCAATEMIFKLKDDMNNASAAIKELKANGQEIPEALTQKYTELTELVGRSGRFNIDSKHYLNVMTQDGKIGLLKLAGRGMTALRSLFERLEAQGIDPTGIDNGRFVVINRSGMGLDTTYDVKELKQSISTEEHGIVEKSVPHVLTDDIISRLATEAFDLSEIYPRLTSEQVADLVAAQQESEEKGGLVADSIFGSVSKSSNTTETTEATTSTTTTNQTTAPVTEAVSTPITETPAIETAVNETSAPAASGTPVTNTQDANEFLNSLGINI
jgi:hypothetical protein